MSEREGADSDGPTPSSRAVSGRVKNTWMLGGILLILSGLLNSGRPEVPYLHIVSVLLFAAALVVFAIGLKSEASVTARKPLGTFALIGLAVFSVLHVFEGQLAGIAQIELLSLLTLISLAARGALALIAVVQIARVAVVPRPWNTLPGWTLVAIAAVNALQIVITQVFVLHGSAGGADAQNTLFAINSVVGLVTMAASLLLGVMAIVLATRASGEQTVPVFHSHEN